MLDPRLRSTTGFVLVQVLLIIALLMGLGVALTTSVTMDSGMNGGYNRATAGFYAAESGLNVGMDTFRNIFLVQNVPASSYFNPQTFTLGARTVTYQLQDGAGNPHTWMVPTGQLFGGLNSIQYTYLVDSKSLYNGFTEADVGAEFNVNNIPLFQFIAFYSNDLEINPGATMFLTGRVHTNGDLYLAPDNTLTIRPDANNPIVQVTARNSIHRGRKDSTLCAGTATITTTSSSPAAQNLNCIGGVSNPVPTSTLATWGGSLISNVRSIAIPTPGILEANSGAEFWANANLRIALDLTTTPPSIKALDVNGAVDATKTTALNNMNANPINWPWTRTLYYTDVPLPTPGCRTPTAGNQKDPNCYFGTPPPTPTITATFTYTPGPGTPTATRTRTPTWSPTPTPTPTENLLGQFSSSDRVYSTNAASPTPAPVDPVSMYADHKYRRGGFYNWREHEWIYLLNVNLKDLLQWNTANAGTSNQLMSIADFPSNAGYVLYLTVIGPNSGGQNNYGVRVFGSDNLPFPVPADGDPTGITVVSDQAMYVAGNYNSSGTKQPAALMGDSINVLSNSALVNNTAGIPCTNDCQSVKDFNLRPATTTTIKAAFLGGVDTTTTGHYNGGLENYPRFHEDWTGDTLNYTGSFVSLGTPYHVDGPWCGTDNISPGFCNIYKPPARNYVYDSDFNDVKNLPPRTPKFVYVQQIVFTENFK